ncbi:MAG: type I restriction enzyme HsdR N-terminal domain-containing protein [Flavobacteriaceae bacterium]|nr:type I restriction enzyme HsdR N-terminal domain-containing protein [Flavobacteriaceae bacterium]
MEKWNELCYILSENLPSNITEKLFEFKVIQAFEKLGWSEFKNEIIVQESIQLGSQRDRMSLDLVFQLPEKGKQFAIEVKRPNISFKSTFNRQLKSYIRQLKLEFGILIGEKIQIFYDGNIFDSNQLILLDEIEFKRENKKGLHFVELFNRENFSINSLEIFAKERADVLKEKVKLNEIKNEVLSDSFNEKVINLIKLELTTRYNEKIIEKVFKVLEVKIENKNKIVPVESFEKRKPRKYSAIENLNEPSGKLPIGKYVRKTFSELVKNNLIDRSEIKRLQRGDYSKTTFDIQFPFLAKENSPYYERVRYWKNPYHINGEIYFVCSQWYEVPANNDRPFYESWLRKRRK